MVIIMLGAPGTGKGTIAFVASFTSLACKLNSPVLVTKGKPLAKTISPTSKFFFSFMTFIANQEISNLS